MGCTGSKAAEAPKSEVASSTLLANPDEPKGEVPVATRKERVAARKERVANATAGKIEETANELPATQGSAPETTTKKVAANATTMEDEEPPKEVPGDAITAKVEEAAETQGAPKSSPDATVTEAK